MHSSDSSTPRPRQSPTAAESPGPASDRSKAASRSRAYLDIADMVPNLTILERTVNGQPGLVAQLDGATVTVFAFDVAGDRIKNIRAMNNPE